MMMGYVSAGFAAVAMLSSAAAYTLFNAYNEQRDQTVRLEVAAEKARIEREYAEKLQNELNAVRERHSNEIREIVEEAEASQNKLSLELLDAQERARAQPLAFGDDVLRSFIRADCLLSLGEASTRAVSRKSCDREAQEADTASQGLAFTVLTPQFLRGWADACEDLEHIDAGYSMDEWRAEYQGFTPSLCHDSLAAMTAESSIFIRKFVEKSADYTVRLWQHIEEQDDIIETIQSQKKDRDH